MKSEDILIHAQSVLSVYVYFLRCFATYVNIYRSTNTFHRGSDGPGS